MNVVHLLISGEIGGVEVLTREISKVSEHNNIFYFVFTGGVIADELKPTNTVHIQNGSHKDFIGEAEKFTKFCKEQNADVVISHLGSPIIRFLGTYAKKKLGNKIKYILYWHHNANGFFFQNKIKRAVQLVIEKTAFNTCDMAVAISKSVKQSFVDYGFDADKVIVNYNGISLNKFTFTQKEKQSTFNIAYVGRLYYKKGVHLLVEAISLLPKDVDIHLDLIGKSVTIGSDEVSDYGNSLMELAKKQGTADKITLCGPQSNVEEWLAKSNLFVHPAIIDEGFGISLAEALASGLPCIAFDKGAMREIIEHGKNGFIAEEESAECLAKYIERVYRLWQNNYDEYMKMCAYSRDSAVKFSIESTTAELENLYKQD